MPERDVVESPGAPMTSPTENDGTWQQAVLDALTRLTDDARPYVADIAWMNAVDAIAILKDQLARGASAQSETGVASQLLGDEQAIIRLVHFILEMGDGSDPMPPEDIADNWRAILAEQATPSTPAGYMFAHYKRIADAFVAAGGLEVIPVPAKQALEPLVEASADTPQASKNPVPPIPEGWRLVPVELTREMAIALWLKRTPREIWEAVLAASPNPHTEGSTSPGQPGSDSQAAQVDGSAGGLR